MTFSALDSRITGPLFATQAMREVFSDRARIGAMLRMEAALARVQAQHGLVPSALADSLAALTPDLFDLSRLGQETALAGVPTIPFVKAVQSHLPRELERGLHKGATTQDVIDTALVLQMRDAFGLVRADLVRILAGLERLADEHRGVPCAGRTYGQHAAPVTFGFKAAIWLTGVADAAAQLPWLAERVLAVSLGGPVGTLAGLGAVGPAVADGLSAELGLAAPPISWHALRARMAEAGSWLAILIGALAKMATDVADLASTEIGEVAEPYAPGRGGSSAMPHKRNPVSSTIILAAHATAKGLVAPLLDAMAASHERPAGAWHAEWQALPQLFGLASGALREAAALAEGMTIRPERMGANLDLTRGLLFADAAAARLASRLGREEAHDIVERAAAEVLATGDHLRTVLERVSSVPLDDAFDLAPSIEAAGRWIERALDNARHVRQTLSDQR